MSVWPSGYQKIAPSFQTSFLDSNGLVYYVLRAYNLKRHYQTNRHCLTEEKIPHRKSQRLKYSIQNPNISLLAERKIPSRVTRSTDSMKLICFLHTFS